MKTKLILSGLFVGMLLSSCGLFKKDCNCPHFGKVDNMQQTPRSAA